MERKIRVLPSEVLLEEYRKLLESRETEALPLVISGNSMSPFLVHGRDVVWLSKLERPAKKGDVLLYQRDSGEYILHRVMKADKNGYTMLGDAQTKPEPGIRPDQIIAVMSFAERKGKKQAPGSFWWEFFEKVWIRAVFLRKPAVKIYGAAKKLFRQLFYGGGLW